MDLWLRCIPSFKFSHISAPSKYYYSVVLYSENARNCVQWHGCMLCSLLYVVDMKYRFPTLWGELEKLQTTKLNVNRFSGGKNNTEMSYLAKKKKQWSVFKFSVYWISKFSYDTPRNKFFSDFSHT